MKQLGIFLLYLCLSSMTITLCTEFEIRHHRPKGGSGRKGGNNRRSESRTSKRKNKPRKGDSDNGEGAPSQGRRFSSNKWFNMIIAAFGEMAGGVDLQDKIIECLPDPWKPKSRDDEKNKADDNAAESAGQSANVFTKILDVLSKVINFLCKFKALVAKMLGKKMKRFYRRQQMRMNFMEVQSSRPRRGFKYYRKWFGSRVVKKMANVAKRAFNKAKQIGKKIIQTVKRLTLWVVKEIKDIFHTLVAKIKHMVNNPIFRGIFKVVKCVATTGLINDFREILNTILGIVDRVQRVIRAIASQTYVDLVVVVVELICNFDHFRAAIGFIVSAIREKRTLQKYILIGRFFGKLLYAFGTGGSIKGKGKKTRGRPKRRNNGRNNRRRNSNRGGGRSRNNRRRGRRGF